MAARLGPKKEELPYAFKQFEELALRLEGVGGKLLVEQKYAIDESLQACEYFAERVWFRAIADVVVFYEYTALAVDYKSGKVIDDSVQLALMCACIFAHYPKIENIVSEYWWLREDTITRAIFNRKDMLGIWKGVWPRIEQLKLAWETNNYPPKPGGLCKRYCPVVSCEYYGKGS